MISLRRALERGRANHGWLVSFHTFSFGTYYDPDHMGVSVLRVINEDRVEPGGGFPPHDHRDMEIISYVLDGALEHRDSLGNQSMIRPGEVQRMSAGTGVTHSEFNASNQYPVHFLQIWILPNVKGIEPGYEQKLFEESEKRGCLRLVASPDGEGGSITIHQDARLYAAHLNGDEVITHTVVPGKTYYIHAARGRLTVNDHALRAGDGITLIEEPQIRMNGGDIAEILLFELP